jgi:hypothetical protein
VKVNQVTWDWPNGVRVLPHTQRVRSRAVHRGYAEGPAAEEAERRREELARGVAATDEAEAGQAVYGSTEAEPERHLIGWIPDVDPDSLFDSGQAWGLTVVRRRRP